MNSHMILVSIRQGILLHQSMSHLNPVFQSDKGSKFQGRQSHLFTFLIRIFIFEWFVVWCGSNNGCRKEECLKEIGLRAQNLMTILG